jgi:UDP-N-acetylmuramate dehydrogenase
MGLGGFLAARGDAEHYAREQAREEDEIFNVLESVRLVSPSGSRRESAAERIGHGYRWTELIESGDIVASATLRLTPASRERIEEKTQEVARKRRGALPAEPNAGSVFRNPPNDYAGRLIEACGLKGRTEGGAVISERLANVIVNRGGARADDVMALMRSMLLPSRNGLALVWFPRSRCWDSNWN